MNITFIGGGNMASALIAGLLRNGLQPDQVRVVEIDAAARKRLTETSGVGVFEHLREGLAGSECVVLAVKPQGLQAVARELAPLLGDQLVISIAAGVRAADLKRWLRGHGRIVRAMPNTPALVLQGVTGLFADQDVDAADRRSAEDVLAVAGSTLWVEDETQMDAVTAVSGSGPAYVFFFIEALERAATELGLNVEQSRMLALETFAGAARLARESAESPGILRERVTSRGGTTECALAELKAQGVDKKIMRAVRAAADRSLTLGDQLGRDATGSNA